MLVVGTDCAGSGMIHLWDVRAGRKLRSIEAHKECVGAVAFSPGGRYLLSGEGRLAGEDSIRVWDASTGAEVARFEGHRGPVVSLAFSPDGKLLASASEDATALVWDWEKIRKTLP
jgi:WD40 repeat protein